ncbi:glycoside hydrolase family 2 TIM barrel-domain containing protein [Psychrobacillus sp.]|uniref:glycoside hydrolase family 2 TIM barrel-domain containing protein n=1 Tax=Psychrobacillus sp. TaxID=1871623 RepID=UPI0028BE0267|nr:glycoside hydrolase family 2 TIM barrel-domain containing protein [Psychrobacillus sp.]
MKTPSLDWLTDVNVFAVNRVPAHSDHLYYATMEEARKKGEMRFRHSLNGPWKFNYAANLRSRVEQFYENDFDANGWDTIQVPGHIQLQGFGKSQYVNTMYPWDGHEVIRPPAIPVENNPVGSYLKTFTLPENMKNQPLYISFQGVETAFYVWLNGEFVGYSEDSFTPSNFELTPYLQAGENKLAVEVYQRSTGSWLEDQDFWRFSGIFRDVYLYSKPSIHVEDVYVHTHLDDTFTNAILEVNLQMDTDQEITVSLVIEDADHKVVEEVKQEKVSSSCTVKLSVKNPQLWSAESPYLYQVFIKLYNQSGTLIEVIPQNVGFRRFEMKNKIMQLNGKRILFKGVNRHEFNCHSGRLVTKEDMLWDIKTLKQNNINAVRTAHYPNQSYWYDLCDQYGIYVMDEMNLETHGSWQKMGVVEPSWVIPGNLPQWQNIVMDRAVSMFERDKNHPSILIWSCGNESYAGEVIQNVTRYFKKVDSSRLVHYEGVFYDRNYSETSDMESQMYTKPADIEKYLMNNPDKPYISCEYMHAMGNSLGGMKKYTDLGRKYPMYQGGFIWDYIDQGIVKKDRYGQEFLAYGGDFGDRPTDNNFCFNGIVYANRELSPKMQEVRFLYQNIKLIPDRNGVEIINDQLFKDTSDLVLEYRLLFEGEQLFRAQKQVNIEPGSKEYIELDIPAELIKAGEYVVQTALLLKEKTIWANEGFELSFGEYVFQKDKQDFISPEGTVRVVKGDVNIGVHGEHFSTIFSLQMGSLISLNYAGKEMIEQAPSPLFWRALTDNDKGNQTGFDMSAWYAASLCRKCIGFDVQDKKAYATIRFDYALSIDSAVKLSVSYTVYADGRMKVSSSYQGVAGLPKMPIFGVTFKMSADYHQLDWYANGPEENYIDRANGARLGRFRNKVPDNVAAYSVPQESGNRTGVRRVDVINNEGTGIRISSTDQPIECNISPYTAFELENAAHHYELPAIHYTVVTVAGKQMGVGGDDSWGAPVHEEFRINAEKDLYFEFMIEPK